MTSRKSTYIADLHTHSTASDGQYTPAELVSLALDKGLEVLAITDHDTIDGLSEALAAARSIQSIGPKNFSKNAKNANSITNDKIHAAGYSSDLTKPAKPAKTEHIKHAENTMAGVPADEPAETLKAKQTTSLKIIPGIELGAKEYRNLHILGYNIDLQNKELIDLCNEMKTGRDERNYRIINFLKERNVIIPLEEVEELAGGDVIGRPHFAQIMVRHGYVKNNREAFDLYLDTDEYQLIERAKPDAHKCIEIIKNAGGMAAVAHPYQIGLDNEELDLLLGELTKYGLDAIECYYPKHLPEQTEFYLTLAKKHGLHITGGSDFHGERVKPDIRLASIELDLDWLLEV